MEKLIVYYADEDVVQTAKSILDACGGIPKDELIRNLTDDEVRMLKHFYGDNLLNGPFDANKEELEYMIAILNVADEHKLVDISYPTRLPEKDRLIEAIYAAGLTPGIIAGKMIPTYDTFRDDCEIILKEFQPSLSWE